MIIVLCFVLGLDDLPGGSGGIALSPQDMFRLGQQLVDEIDSRAAKTIQSGMYLHCIWILSFFVFGFVAFSLFVLRLLCVVLLSVDL